MVRECVIGVHSKVRGEKDTGLSLNATELWAEQDPHVDPNLLLTTSPPSSDLSGFPGAGLSAWDLPQRIASSIPGSCPHDTPVPMPRSFS